MIKSTVILSDFLQIPIGFEWYDDGLFPYHISDWIVPNHCQGVANRTDFLNLSAHCTLRHDILSSMMNRICTRSISKKQVEKMLGISSCQVIHDLLDTVPRVIETWNDCASSWYRSNILPHAPKILSSHTLKIGVHFRMGDVHDGVYARTDNGHIIGPIVRVLDSASTLDSRSISFTDVVSFLKNIVAEGCHVKLSIYALGVEKVVGLPFPYELVNTGNDRRDFLDYVSNDVMIQGVSSFSALAAFATGKHKVVVTDKKGHPKYFQAFQKTVDVLHPTDALKVKCPIMSVGSNFARNRGDLGWH